MSGRSLKINQNQKSRFDFDFTELKIFSMTEKGENFFDSGPRLQKPETFFVVGFSESKNQGWR